MKEDLSRFTETFCTTCLRVLRSDERFYELPLSGVDGGKKDPFFHVLWPMSCLNTDGL